MYPWAAISIPAAAIERMRVEFGCDPAKMIVQLSPCIRPPNYEVDFAAQIVAQAREDASNTRHDADDYVIDSLQNLEEEVTKLLTQVRNGIRKIEEDRLHGPAQPAPDMNSEPITAKNN